jgi:hypothetical protein
VQHVGVASGKEFPQRKQSFCSRCTAFYSDAISGFRSRRAIFCAVSERIANAFPYNDSIKDAVRFKDASAHTVIKPNAQCVARRVD